MTESDQEQTWQFDVTTVYPSEHEARLVVESLTRVPLHVSVTVVETTGCYVPNIDEFEGELLPGGVTALSIFRAAASSAIDVEVVVLGAGDPKVVAMVLPLRWE